jgi:hypothetical protein
MGGSEASLVLAGSYPITGVRARTRKLFHIRGARTQRDSIFSLVMPDSGVAPFTKVCLLPRLSARPDRGTEA